MSEMARCPLHSVVGERLADHETRVRKLEAHDYADKAAKRASEFSLRLQVFVLSMLGGFCGSAGGHLASAWINYLKGVLLP